jgi:hypothetical protein
MIDYNIIMRHSVTWGGWVRRGKFLTGSQVAPLNHQSRWCFTVPLGYDTFMTFYSVSRQESGVHPMKSRSRLFRDYENGWVLGPKNLFFGGLP